MSLFWLYDIPTWGLFLLIIGVLASVSLLGCLVLRDRFDRWLGLSEEGNDVVGHFLAFTGAFYGIMLGLVAVGAWETFNSASDAVDNEASTLAALYRDVTQLPWPQDGRGQAHLRRYSWEVINREWPDQRIGQMPTSAERTVNALGSEISGVRVDNLKTQVLMAEALRQYNQLLEARRDRIQSTQGALPIGLWFVIIFGAVINIVMTWLLEIKNVRLDVFINVLMAALLGSVLAFIIAMDHPYRGELSVSADPIAEVYHTVMDGSDDPPSEN
jgi:Protein of unknown function (DUF4239)